MCVCVHVCMFSCEGNRGVAVSDGAIVSGFSMYVLMKRYFEVKK